MAMKIDKKYHRLSWCLMISWFSGQRDQVLWLTGNIYIYKSCTIQKNTEKNLQKYLPTWKNTYDAWGKKTREVKLQTNLCSKSYDMKKDPTGMWKNGII